MGWEEVSELLTFSLLVLLQSLWPRLANLCPTGWALNRHGWKFLVQPPFSVKAPNGVTGSELPREPTP